MGRVFQNGHAFLVSRIPAHTCRHHHHHHYHHRHWLSEYQEFVYRFSSLQPHLVTPHHDVFLVASDDDCFVIVYGRGQREEWTDWRRALTRPVKVNTRVTAWSIRIKPVSEILQTKHKQACCDVGNLKTQSESDELLSTIQAAKVLQTTVGIPSMFYTAIPNHAQRSPCVSEWDMLKKWHESQSNTSVNEVSQTVNSQAHKDAGGVNICSAVNPGKGWINKEIRGETCSCPKVG